MFGMSKPFLAAVVTFLAADSAALACGGRLPTGADCYADDNGFYHSLYDDWRGLVGSPSQKHRPSRRNGHVDAD